MSIPDVRAIIERMKGHLRIRSDADLAAYFRDKWVAETPGGKHKTLTGTAVRRWRERNSIALEYLVSFCHWEGVELDWLVLGRRIDGKASGLPTREMGHGVDRGALDEFCDALIAMEENGEKVGVSASISSSCEKMVDLIRCVASLGDHQIDALANLLLQLRKTS